MRNNPTYTQPGTLGALDALSEILSGVKRDVARSREVLNGAFGKIAARFAQVHAIAVAAEARESGLSDEALNALRKVTDGLTIELQFEDSLSQLLDHVQGKVEAIGVALTETRTLVSSAPAGEPEPVGPALEVLARTVKSIQMAAEAAVADRSTASGSVELF
jgi:hypothetical protein